MERGNINNVVCDGENVTSTYAEIYFDNAICKTAKSRLHQAESIENQNEGLREQHHDEIEKDEWVSPSDLLIGILDLKPPFTSKITRGKTHEGILTIGNAVVENEYTRFLKILKELVQDNDSAWNYILLHEKEEVVKKVKVIFENVFKHKSKIMQKELTFFYEATLQDLEKHLISEVQTVLQSTYAYTISNLNSEIQQKLKKEKRSLENTLRKKYVIEVQKIKKYYKILLNNELHRNNQLINNALNERNDAVKVFCRQMEAEKTTSSMYIMSLERKKCIIKRMLLENFQTAEISNKLQKIKEKREIIKTYAEPDTRIADINKYWEEKIKIILQLFLKFVSFSLRLLPEQTTFLLDLQKMVVLQLNDIQKYPTMESTVLINEDDQANIFKFERETKEEILTCTKEPFIIIGDLSEPIPPRYGSRETLPSDVDLLTLRVQRQYVYAKCHGYENIKKLIDTEKCKCRTFIQKPLEKESVQSIMVPPVQSIASTSKSESCFEPMFFDEIIPERECPGRKCIDWLKINTFPNLPSYLDYTEENFKRVTVILEDTPKNEAAPKLINTRDIAYSDLPFSATKELHRTVETQYSSQEDLSFDRIECNCTCTDNIAVRYSDSSNTIKPISSEALRDILLKRKISLARLLRENANLHKLLTDECFDYKL